MKKTTSPSIFTRIEKIFLWGEVQEYHFYLTGFDRYLVLKVKEVLSRRLFLRRFFEETKILPVIPAGEEFRSWINQIFASTQIINKRKSLF